MELKDHYPNMHYDGGGLYVIKTAPDLKDSLHLPFEEYAALRNLLLEKLKVFFDTIEYNDADHIDSYIRFICIKSDPLHWKAMNVFHVSEWLENIRKQTVDEEFEKRLKVIKLQHNHATGIDS